MRQIALMIGLAYFGSVAFIACFAAFFTENSHPTDVIVVLGAGMEADGTLHRSSILRVEKGVFLYNAGLAPRIHFTGGRAPGMPSAGARMAALAGQMGVPEDVMSFEQESQSTLQNALFSQPFLRDADSLRLVSEGFHLPRSWLSFRWAGTHHLEVSISERFRKYSPNARIPQVSMVVREGLAFWFNWGRVIAHSGAEYFGVDDATRDSWLE